MMIELDTGSFQYASERLRGDKHTALVAIRSVWKNIQHVSEKLRRDKTFSLAATEQTWMALQFVSVDIIDAVILRAALEQLYGEWEPRFPAPQTWRLSLSPPQMCLLDIAQRILIL